MFKCFKCNKELYGDEFALSYHYEQREGDDVPMIHMEIIRMRDVSFNSKLDYSHIKCAKKGNELIEF